METLKATKQWLKKKTHKIQDLCRLTDKTFDMDLRIQKLITDMATVTRYPNVREITLEEMQLGIKYANKIFQDVNRIIEEKIKEQEKN